MRQGRTDINISTIPAATKDRRSNHLQSDFFYLRLQPFQRAADAPSDSLTFSGSI